MMVRQYTEKNMLIFEDKIRNLNMDAIFSCNNAQSAFTLLYSLYLKAYNGCFPLRSIKINDKKQETLGYSSG